MARSAKGDILQAPLAGRYARCAPSDGSDRPMRMPF